METSMLTPSEMAERELYQLLAVGIQDVEESRVYDLETVFDELEKVWYMNKYRILLTKNAKDDLIEIRNYITYDLLSPDISKKFIYGLRKSISQLYYFPYKFPQIKTKYIDGQSYRYMPYKNFLVFYEIKELEYTIHILRILYKKRNWAEILR